MNSVERQGAISRRQIPCQHQLSDLRWRRVAARVLDDHPRVGRRQSGGHFERRRHVLGSIGRVEKDDVEAIWRRGLEPRREPRKIHADNSIALFEAAVGQVGLDERRRAPVAVDKSHVPGAAAQRFDPHRSGPGKAIEHPRAGHVWPEHVEERFTQLVGRRPHARPVGRRQPAALLLPRDHPHWCFAVVCSAVVSGFSRTSA